MLTFIRSNVQSFFVKTVILLVVVVMGFFGIDAFNQEGANVLATVNQEEIYLTQYQRAYQSAEAEMRNRFGAKAGEVMKRFDLKRETLARLINDALLVQAAKESGIVVTDLEVAEAIRAISYLATDGRFDGEKYQRLLDQNRITSRIFEEDLRKNLTAQKFIGLVMAGHSVSRNYVRALADRGATRLEFQTLELNAAEFFTNATVTEEEARDYYEKNSIRFHQPRRYAIQYILLKGEEAKGKVRVKLKELEKYYQRNKAEFEAKPSWHSRHILIEVPQDGNQAGIEKARKKAERLSLELRKNPALFAAKAKAFSADQGSKNKGGDLGWSRSGQLLGPFEKALKTLSPGEISAPILTQFGYHVIQLIEKKAGKSLTFAEAKEQIELQVKRKKGQRRQSNLAAKFLNIARNQGMQEAAKQAGRPLEKSPFFDQKGLLPQLGMTHQLYQALQGKPLGGKGSFVLSEDRLIYEVTEIQEASTQPYAEVTEKAKQLAEMEKSARLAQEKMAQVAQKATDAKGFAELAKELRQTPKKYQIFYRDQRVEGIPNARAVAVKLYASQAGEVTVLPTRDRALLLYLKKKTPGHAAEIEVSQLETKLKEEKAQVLLSGLVEEYKKSSEVHYNQKLAKALDLAI